MRFRLFVQRVTHHSFADLRYAFQDSRITSAVVDALKFRTPDYLQHRVQFIFVRGLLRDEAMIVGIWSFRISEQRGGNRTRNVAKCAAALFNVKVPIDVFGIGVRHL